jgi:hypothetical protein
MESVNVSFDANMYRLVLKDSLLRSLQFAKVFFFFFFLSFSHVSLLPTSQSPLNRTQVGEYELAWVDGRVTADMTTSATVIADAHAGHVPAVAALEQAPGLRGHAHTMVGDVRIAELRQLLLREGIDVRFRRVSLRCADDRGSGL